MSILKSYNTKKTVHIISTLALCSTALFSAHSYASTDTLRVCAAANELPYSNKSEQGFENGIAKVLAKKMNRELEFVWSDKAAIYLVTEMLNKNKCDVVIGLDSDDSRIATSTPYYKSGYVFVYPEKSALNIKGWASPDLLTLNKFAIVPGSPSEAMLREIGKYEGTFNYLMSLINFKSRRNQYVRYQPDRMISEVASGKADIAHVWAPEVARYVKSSREPLTMVVSSATAKTSDGEGIVQHFEQSIGVRRDDKNLLKEINIALQQSDSEIKSILQEEGIPLL
ncbi:MAG: methanol oxidation system protein MoxJ [Gammaproteobacteria bacterium]|nr:MAG: methanol oxidation system protein MoxJ [Gammaproteobacteria bacterium]